MKSEAKLPSYPAGSAKHENSRSRSTRRLINKNETGDKTLFTDGWENVELTPDELAAKVQQGIAYCAQLRGPRKASNFLGG